MADQDNPANRNPIQQLSDLLSADDLDLLAATGNHLIESIGIGVIREVVFDVLTGRNIRSSTESLTRRRIATINLALVKLFLEGSKVSEQFVEHLPYLGSDILSTPKPRAEEWLASWIMGLTGKGIQNVLRDDRNLIPEYRDNYIEICREVVEQVKANYGDLKGTLVLDSGQQIQIDWLFLLYLLNAAGSQTLTIRGSEKSLYGKFFEKLVLGALLHILGFKHVPSRSADGFDRVFWLASQRERERESDATLLYKAGQGIRFDIGFIGRGNTEISLDKVSRYRREIEIGSKHFYMGTIIIVDRIGERSAIQDLANDIDGTIVQMSAGYWPQRIARKLYDILGYRHALVDMDHDEIEDYLHQRLTEVPLMEFIRSATA